MLAWLKEYHTHMLIWTGKEKYTLVEHEEILDCLSGKDADRAGLPCSVISSGRVHFTKGIEPSREGYCRFIRRYTRSEETMATVAETSSATEKPAE